MPTERLFDHDPYLRHTTARVVAMRAVGGSSHMALDRTVFYPEGGGQPDDRGTLGGVPVQAVYEEDRVIWHVVPGPAPAGEVSLALDWERRFDHMQQHAAQHVLSAVLVGRARPTHSFHLGTVASTIDVGGDPLDPATAATAEAAANAVLWSDRPITCRVVGAAVAGGLPLRKETSRTGDVRLVEVEGCDLSACGGTHPARTGECGLVKVIRLERYKGGTRVYWVAGGRALADYAQRLEALGATAAVLSCGPAEVPAAAERALAEQAELRDRLKDLAAREAELAAQYLAARAELLPNGLKVVLTPQAGRTAAELQALGQRLALVPELAGVLVAESDGLRVVAFTGAQAPVTAKGLIAHLNAALGLRGGGSDRVAQGGGDATPAEVLEAARQWLEGAQSRQD
ncbi:MAG: DHHA1 domain-containing protein [Bacillota bacterium]